MPLKTPATLLRMLAARAGFASTFWLWPKQYWLTMLMDISIPFFEHDSDDLLAGKGKIKIR